MRAGSQRPQGQIAMAEQLAGLYRPITDPQAQADAIADELRPMIAAKLAAIRAARPGPTAHEIAIREACRAVGAAADRLDSAEQRADRNACRNAERQLRAAANRLKKLIDREAGHGSR